MEKMEEMIDFCRSIIADSMISENAPVVKVILPSLGPSQPQLNQVPVDSQEIQDATGINLDLLIESRAHATIEQYDLEIWVESPMISAEILRRYPFFGYYRLSVIQFNDCDSANLDLLGHSTQLFSGRSQIFYYQLIIKERMSG